MSSTILVIDSNAAVQAITALALSETGCAIEQLTVGALALERITKLRPTVVLIAKELTGVDPLQVPGRMKSLVPETRYVLLAPADGSATLETRATEAGFSAVLFKPFKSNRLREVVTKLLIPPTPTEPLSLVPAERPRIYLNLEDRFLTSLFQRLLSRTNADISFDGTPSSDQPYAATIAYWRPDAAATTHDAALFGKLLLICTAEHDDRARIAQPLAEILTLPFAFVTLRDALLGRAEFSRPLPSPMLPEVEQFAVEELPRLSDGLALLAARISAAIYERLLTQPALKQQDWEQAATLARDETLRVVADRTG